MKTEITHKIKVNGYNSSVLWAKREAKRVEAEERQAKHNGLSKEQKISNAVKRGGSVKELKKLRG